MQCSKWLVIIASIIRITYCAADDSKTPGAISRMKFVQFQPANEQKKNETSTTTEAHRGTNDLESRHSNIFPKATDGPLEDHSADETLVPKNYAFAYAIKDRHTGDDFSHSQAHNGRATKGQYRVKLPDGRVQVVTYLADTGGYRADIRYDQEKNIILVPQEEADSSRDYNMYSNEHFSASAKTDNLAVKPSRRYPADNLVYYNDVRSYGLSSNSRPQFSAESTSRRTPASYETVEHIDEDQLPYDRKLIDDVNYLLRIVTPTIESNTQNVFDITADKIYKPLPIYKLPTEDTPNIRNKIIELNVPQMKYVITSTARPERLDITSTRKYTFPHQELLHRKALFTPINKNNEKPGYRPTPKAEHQPLFRPIPSKSSAHKIPVDSSQFGISDYTTATMNEAPESYSLRPPDQVKGALNTEAPNLQPQNPQMINRKPANYYPPNYPILTTEKTPVPALQFPEHLGNSRPSQRFRPSQPYTPNTEQKPRLILNMSHKKHPPPVYHTQPIVRWFSGSNTHLHHQPRQHNQYEGPYNPSLPEIYHDHKQKEIVNEKPHAAHPPSYDSQEHPPVEAGPTYNSEEYPQISSGVNTRYQEEDPSPVVTAEPESYQPPSSPTDTPRFNPETGKLEIPQYLHIHKYESGEDGKPKELIYYTPLHIQVPNSIAYIEQGSNTTGNFETMIQHHPNSQNSQLGPIQQVQQHDIPGYIESLANVSSATPKTLEYPPEGIEAPNQKSPFHHTIDNSKYVAPEPNFSPSPSHNYHGNDNEISQHSKNPPTLSPITSKEDEENHGQLSDSYYDPRTYSGYFDFLTSAEMEEDKKELNDVRDHEPAHQKTDHKLPQYVHNFATATPSYRYQSTGIWRSHSGEMNDLHDQSIHNSTFRLGSYLRPLHKERVYIHHNSQPTTTTTEIPISKYPSSRSIDSQSNFDIIKSISSTIPAELLRDFDEQLNKSIFKDISVEASEPKANVKKPPFPSTYKPPLKTRKQGVNKTDKLFLKSVTDPLQLAVTR